MRKPKRKRSPYRPLFGFLLAVGVGVAAWITAPTVIGWGASVLPAFRGNELPLSTTRPIFTVLTVIISLGVFALVAAVLTPKDKDAEAASATTLERDREALRRRQKTERAEARKTKGRH
jgi:hypothetical protein